MVDHVGIRRGARLARPAFLAMGVAIGIVACGGGSPTALQSTGLQSGPGYQQPQAAAPNTSQQGTAQAPVAPGAPQAPAVQGPAPAGQPAGQAPVQNASAAAPGGGAAKPAAGAPVPAPRDTAAILATPPGSVYPWTPGTAGANFASDVGVTKDTINIGNISMQSATRSLGPALAGATLRSSDALVRYINDMGGIAGRKLNLIYCDDGGDVTRARACYEKLKTQVFAFVPSESWLTQTLHQTLDADKVPMLSWGWFISEYNDPYMFPCHANGAREAVLTSKYVIENVHPKTVAIMYLNDPEDISATDEAQKLLEQSGIKVVARIPQEWDSPDESQHVLSARVANPDVVMVFTWPTPLAKFLHDAAGQNWAPAKGYWAKHVMGDAAYGPLWGDYAKDKLASLASYEVPGAVNQAQAGTDTHWGLQEWRFLTQKYTGYSNAGLTFKYAMGFHITQAAISCINVAAASFRAIGPNLTRPLFMQYLESHQFDTGQGIVLKWPHGDHGQEPYSFNHEFMYMYSGAPDGGWQIKRLWPDPVMIG